LYLLGEGYEGDADTHEDVDFSHPGRWSQGLNLFSRLSWADHVRNTRIAYELQKKEPLVVLEAGCGSQHYMGVAIAGMGLDTHYVGIDRNPVFAERILESKGRRGFFGIAHDCGKGLPLVDDSCDVVLCLEAMEHFCQSFKQVKAFFGEVARVMKPWGVFYLATPVPDVGVTMHPHCHPFEFTEKQVLDACVAEGMSCWQRFNYRARPQVAKKIRLLADDELARGQGFPPALVDAYELPKLTYNALVPGNALYIVGHR
jgi:SAM-dependent methyltransferase